MSRRSRRQAQDERQSSGWLAPALGGLAVAIILIVLHVAANSGHSPFDRGINHHGHRNLPGNTWTLLVFLDSALLVIAFYGVRTWIRNRSAR